MHGDSEDVTGHIRNQTMNATPTSGCDLPPMHFCWTQPTFLSTKSSKTAENTVETWLAKQGHAASSL